MHKRLYSLLCKYNCIYINQLRFRKHHSTIHALIGITEHIRYALDNNDIACGIFIDLQKAFDTVDHEILLKQLAHYGIRGLANDWFESYLLNRYQFVSINGYESNILPMKHGISQGSVLGPLLFLMYVNDLHNSIKYCKVRHFADDTNLLIISNKSPKSIQNYINFDLKNLCKWLRANRISLNSSKRFINLNKKNDYDDFKIKMNGKKLYPSKFVKYLGVLIDAHLNFGIHINSISTKLARATGMLAKIRHYTTKNILRSIYFGIFPSILTYGCQIWGQIKSNHFIRLERLHNKAIRIINFASMGDSVTPLYKVSKILKLSDIIRLLNVLLVFDDVNDKLPPALKNTFHLTANSHYYPTRGSVNLQVSIPSVKTTVCGLKSIIFQSCQDWNCFIKHFRDKALPPKSKNICKKILTDFFLNSY